MATGRRRGFLAMDPATQRKIASQGGRKAHELGHAHEWDAKEAREAGRKGGLSSARRRAERLQQQARTSEPASQSPA